MNVYSVSLNSNMFSIGSLLGGNQGVNTLTQSLSSNDPRLAFYTNSNSPLRDRFQSFVKGVVNVVSETGAVIRKTTDIVINRNYYRPLQSLDALSDVPKCMQLPIVYYEPVRTLLEDGLISGYGIDPRELESEDIFVPVLNSGYVKDLTAEDVPEDGYITITHHYSTADPQLTPRQINAIRLTREYIDKVMMEEATKHLDVTDPKSLRG